MIPGFDLVANLFMQFLIWLVVYTSRAIWRGLRSAVFEHPLITLAVLGASNELGYLTPFVAPLDPRLTVALVTWVPLFLALVVVARFVSGEGPAAIKRNLPKVTSNAARMVRDLTIWSTAREWAAERKRRRGLPPPPRPGPAGSGDVLNVREVHTQPGVPAEAFAGGDSLVNGNGRSTS